MIIPGYRLWTPKIITAAAAGVTTEVVERLEGIRRITPRVNFVYGSGGTSFKVYLQTSLDQGVTWRDIMCVALTTASAIREANLTDATAVTTLATPTDGTLTDNTAISGILGDRFRWKYTSTGTYGGNTTINLSAVVA
jgi:hypothetical protein